MIITVTPNPAIDQTVFVSGLSLGEVNRFRESQLDHAGKGVNVSRMVHRLGWPTFAFGFLAGEIGAIVERTLNGEGVQHHFIDVPGQTRLNTTLVDLDGRGATSFYGPGPTVGEIQVGRLDDLLGFWLRGSGVAVLAGSLLPGMPPDAYARYIRMAHSAGIKAILDADGEALAQGIAAKPALIKPNRLEAEHLLGRPLKDIPDVVQGARELVEGGAGAVVISMGARGAVCVSAKEAWLAVPPPVDLKSTVGSGDSMVAGLAIALVTGQPLSEGLRLGTAAGAATAMVPGTMRNDPPIPPDARTPKASERRR